MDRYIYVGGHEIVSIDTADGGVTLCDEDHEIGNIIGNAEDGFEFAPNCDESEEVGPYADWPIDCKVLVWNEGNKSCVCNAHFAGIDDCGRPMAWNDGLSSWTTCVKFSWDYAERVED